MKKLLKRLTHLLLIDKIMVFFFFFFLFFLKLPTKDKAGNKGGFI